MSEVFFSDALALAANVPARSREEMSAWQCRGLTEIALCVLISGSGLDQLDEQVANLDLTFAPQRFLTRLVGLRSMLGPVPDIYHRSAERLPSAQPSSEKVISDVRIACELADSLLQASLRQEATGQKSALKGVGEAAFLARKPWRPASPDQNSVEFVEVPELDLSLLWRAWMTTPNGLKMVVPNQCLDPVRMDVWWGVHNGAHLDHLWLRKERGPSPLEFGSGLLVAEALAMSSELLLSLESFHSGDFAVSNAVAFAIVERAGRLDLPKLSGFGRSYDVAAADESAEFVALPVLSEAYICGPLDLIRRQYVDALIPIEITEAFQSRWVEVAKKNEVAAKFTEKVVNG